MQLPANRFKENLRADRRQIGLWLALADAYCAEICATAGFDFVVIDAEHAPNELRTILAQLQALAAYDAAPVVRLPIGDAVLIKQVLELGAPNIMTPMIESAGQAEAMARAIRYPPRGTRGVGSGLARSSRWTRYKSYLKNADDEVCLIAQVETRAGIERLEAIARVDGVDAIFIGAADLAADMGHLGEPNHPDVVAAVEGAVMQLAALGKPAGILTSDAARARRSLDIGASFVAVGVDSLLLANGARALAQSFADVKS